MPIEGEIVQLPQVVKDRLEKLHAELDELRSKVKQQEADAKDVRRMSSEEYRRAKAHVRSRWHEHERKPGLAVGVTDVRGLTADEYADAFHKTTGRRYRPPAKGVAYATRGLVRDK